MPDSFDATGRFKDSVVKPMVFNDIVVDETFGMVQNEANDRREFSFTAPVSGFYRFEINLQQITQVCFQHDALNFHTHRLSI